jgi:hypothetical protein
MIGPTHFERRFREISHRGTCWKQKLNKEKVGGTSFDSVHGHIDTHPRTCYRYALLECRYDRAINTAGSISFHSNPKRHNANPVHAIHSCRRRSFSNLEPLPSDTHSHSSVSSVISMVPLLSPSSPKRNRDNRMMIWPSIYHFITKLGLSRFLALVLLCTFLVHRSVSRYMSHRPWMLAPIAHVERKCAAPSYQTLSQQDQQQSISSSNNNQKICLTTLTDEKQKSRANKLLAWRNFDGLLELTWKNKQDYADKHGYHLYNESDMLDKSRPPSWSKIVAVERLLREENCTWVFWLDADTVS